MTGEREPVKRGALVFSGAYPVASATVGVLLVGVLDWITGAEISLSLLYLLPIGYAAWNAGRGAACGLSVLAAVVWLICDLLATTFSHPLIPYWNALVRLGSFLILAYLLSRIRTLTDELDQMVERRTAALQDEVGRRKRLELEALDIAQREQERFAHELHDSLGAQLAGIAFRLKALAEGLERRGIPEAAEARSALVATNDGIDQVRGFARLLDPGGGEAVDVGVALTRLGAEVERVYGLCCTVIVSPALPAFLPQEAHHLYRIAQEAVRNAVQHASAKQLEVSAEIDDEELSLIVRNDGVSWAPSTDSGEGLGLRIMRHRTELLRGRLSITSHPSGGTVLKCEVPIPGSGRPNGPRDPKTKF